MENERQVTKAQALQMMRELGFHHYIETSAYTGTNITSLFETLTKHLYLINKDKLNDFVSATAVTL